MLYLSNVSEHEGAFIILISFVFEHVNEGEEI